MHFFCCIYSVNRVLYVPVIYMKKININDKLFNIIANQKYLLAQKKYPELNHIFNVTNDDLSFIESNCAHQYLKKCKSQFQRRWKYIEQTYRNYVYEVALLINKIKYNPNIEEIMYIYAYLYYNGYLSINNEFQFSVPYYELEFRKGLSVLTGQSLCRNIGSMFQDLLEMFDFENYGIITDRAKYKSETNQLIREYYELFTKDLLTIEHESIDTEDNEIKRGNHYEVIVYDKEWHLLDPTAICMYNFTGYNTNYPALNYLCLWSLYATGEHSLKETINLYNLFKDKYIQLCQTEKTFSTQKECYKRCEKNKKKILTFYNKNKEAHNIVNNFFENQVTN